MTTLAITKENSAIVEALKKIGGIEWVGNTTFESMQHCLTSINLSTLKNSGWYNASAVKINGLTGYYMVNQDGSLCYEYRIIKEGEKQFRIENLTMTGFNEFERLYCQIINE